MIAQCCVCRRFRSGAEWLPLPLSFESERVTHTYCPACAEKACAEVTLYATPVMGGKEILERSGGKRTG